MASDIVSKIVTTYVNKRGVADSSGVEQTSSTFVK